LAFDLQGAETTQPELGPDLARLKFSTDRKLGSDTLHVKIEDWERTRYKVPQNLFPPSGAKSRSASNPNIPLDGGEKPKPKILEDFF